MLSFSYIKTEDVARLNVVMDFIAKFDSKYVFI